MNWRTGQQKVKEQRKQRMENVKMRVREIQDTVKWSNMHVTEI